MHKNVAAFFLHATKKCFAFCIVTPCFFASSPHDFSVFHFLFVHKFSTLPEKKLQDFFLVVKILFNIVLGLYLLTHPYKSPTEQNPVGLFSFLLKHALVKPFNELIFLCFTIIFFISHFRCFVSFLRRVIKKL